MNYYRIIRTDSGENILMSCDSHTRIDHTDGVRIEENVETPFEILMYAGEDANYDQYDPFIDEELELRPYEERLFDYYDESSIMTESLVNALLEAGVDNLQIFPTLIKDAFTKEIVEQKYFFVNIVGIVLPVEYEGPYQGLRIDKSSVNGLLIFQVKGYGLVVEERIAKIINSGKFKGMRTELIE